MKKAFLISVIIAIVIVNEFCFAKEFNDLPSNHWAYNQIDELSNIGIINGYNDGSFRPSNTITKAEFIKLLVGCVAKEYEIKELSTKQSFYKNWFEVYYDYACIEGFMEDEFEIDELKEGTTREEMINILASFCKEINVESKLQELDSNDNEISEDEIVSLYGIADNNYNIVNTIPPLDSKYAKTENYYSNFEDGQDSKEYYLFNDIHDLDDDSIDNLYYITKLGLVNGYDDGSFKPNKVMTRAEVSVIIYRFKEITDKIIPKVEYKVLI